MKIEIYCLSVHYSKESSLSIGYWIFWRKENLPHILSQLEEAAKEGLLVKKEPGHYCFADEKKAD